MGAAAALRTVGEIKVRALRVLIRDVEDCAWVCV